MRRLLPTLVLALLPHLASAQSWGFAPGATGEIGFASVRTQNAMIINLSCVTSRFDRKAFDAQTSGGGTHFIQTAPHGAFQLFWQFLATPKAAAQFSKGDAVLVIDRQPFRDIPLDWDELENAITAQIPAGHPVLAALKAGSTAGVLFQSTREAPAVRLSGSARSIGALEQFCTQTRPTPAPAALQAEIEDEFQLEGLVWHARGSSPNEALAFIYASSPSGGNAVYLTIRHYVEQGGQWQNKGVVTDLFGLEPRDVAFGGGAIRVTTSTLRDGDPRCCPSGATRWAIDRRTLKARRN